MTWADLKTRMLGWPGWRRYAPAGASVVANGLAFAAVAGLMASANTVPPARREIAPQMLTVDLLPIQELEALEIAGGVTPPPKAGEFVPPRKTPKAATTPRPPGAPATAPTAPSPAAADDGGDSVYLGPPSVLIQPNVPPGLKSLMGSNDPCAVRSGPRPRECAGRDLAARTGPMDSMLPRTKDDLAQHYAAFMETCPFWSGCDGSHLLSTNGTRSVGKGAPGSGSDRDQPAMMAGGAGSLGGLNALSHPLTPNPDHRDRGFGD